VYEVEVGNWGRVRDQRAVGTGQLILIIGLVWREVRILAQKATTPREIFSNFIITHVLLIVVCCKYASCAIYIFLLCRLKTNQVKEIQNM
jgi:hypothetical protein